MAIIKLEKIIRPIPHGANPDDYVAVRTADGILYRRKRSKGTLLNTVCQQNQSKLQIASPLGRQIRKALLPFIDKKLKETLHYRLNSCLMEGVAAGSSMVNLGVLGGFDFLDKPRDKKVKPLLLSYSYGKETLIANKLLNPEVIWKREKLIRQFRFRAIIIYLNADGETTEIQEHQSPDFSLAEPYEAWKCKVNLQPNRNYLLCLKAECFSGEVVFHHQQTQFFEVVRAGN